MLRARTRGSEVLKGFLRLGIVTVLVCIVMWFVAPEGQAPGIVAGVILLVLLSAALAQPRSRAFAKAHPRAMRTTGVALILATFGVIAVPIIWPELGFSSDLSVSLAVGCMVCAAILITLPTSARQIEALKALQERGGATPLDPKESGPAEALRALRFVRDNPAALARIMLPWSIVGVGSLLASLWIGERLLTDHPGRTGGATVLTMLGASVLLMVVSYPMAALSWARFVAGYPASPFAPARASGAYLWRFLVLTMVGNTFSKQFAPATAYLTDRLGLTDPKSLDSLMSLGGYLAILLVFGPMALVLPAIAVGDSRRASGLVADFFRPGRRYALGVILAAAPFLAINVALEIAIAYLPQAKDLSPWLLLAFVPVLVTFLGIATVMTYLVQVYRRVVAETDVGPYEPFVAEASE